MNSALDTPAPLLSPLSSCPPKLQRRRVLAFSLARAPVRSLHNLFVPMHLETKLLPRKNPPLSKPFRISILQDIEQLRPNPPRLSPLFSTLSGKHSKKRPCLNPLDSIACRPRAKRPCLSPLESHGFRNRGYFFNVFRPSSNSQDEAIKLCP